MSALLPMDAAAAAGGAEATANAPRAGHSAAFRPQQRITGLPLVLSSGAAALPACVLGARLPSCVSAGPCWLVVTSPGVLPGAVPLVVAPQAEPPAAAAAAGAAAAGGGAGRSRAP